MAKQQKAMRLLFFTLFLVIGRTSSESFIIAQAPGSGWALAPTPERTVKTLYWQLFDQTEIWTRIVPKAEAAGQLPFSLVFSATFKGKVLTKQERVGKIPSGITILAQPHPLAALPVPNLSFVLVTDDGDRFDLIANGMASRVLSLGETCCAEAIRADIDVATFLVLAKSKRIIAHVLGFECVLDNEDTSALSEFSRSILAQ